VKDRRLPATDRNHPGIGRRLASLALPCLIVLLGAALRFYDLGAESYWYDEMRTLQIAAGGFRTLGNEFLRGHKPPLYLGLMTLWIRVFGTGEFAARSLSAFASIASVAALFRLGRELFGAKVGALSAALMAISDFQIWYAQESRYYALYLLLVVLSVLFYVRSTERRRPRELVLYVTMTALMCYAYSSGLFVVAAQSLHYVTTHWSPGPRLGKRPVAPWLLAHIGIYFLVSPLLAAILVATRAGRFGFSLSMPDAGIGMLVLTPLRYVAGEHPGLRTVAVASVVFAAGIGTVVLYMGVDDWLASLRQSLASLRQLLAGRSYLSLLLLWLACPILMQWAASKILVRLYIFRYTIGASPALYLLLSLGLVTFSNAVPELLVLGTVVILAGPGLWAYYTEDTRENWRDAAAYVELHVRDREPIIVPNRTLGLHAFRWYFEGTVRPCEAAGSFDEQETLVHAASDCALESSRFWLVLRESFVPGRQLREPTWREAGLKLVEQRVFKGVLVYLFEKGEDESATGTLKPAGCSHPHSAPSRDSCEGEAVKSAQWSSPWRLPVADPASPPFPNATTSRLSARASGFSVRRFRARMSGDRLLALQATTACTA
jgi:4-amino-4-deoxy-L-arabinose transferase-like glycosyltransferase